MSDRISLIYSLARSGSTLLSKCIGCAPGNIILSEVHPRAAYFSPLNQAHEWFGLISADELRRLSEKFPFNYLEVIQLISDRCKDKGLNLIIRDWTHVDFTPGPYPVPPVYRLSHYDLLKDHFDIKQIAMVRDPADTYLSLDRLLQYRGKLSFVDYMVGVRRFADYAVNVGFIRYEDFCADPHNLLQGVCTTLDVNFEEEFQSRYLSYATITGDIPSFGGDYTLTGEKLGTRAGKEIRKVPRRAEDERVFAQLSQTPEYRAVAEMLGYPR